MNNDSNLPPGVRVSDLPGNRPLDALWDRYCAEFDTGFARREATDALIDLFDWKGLERTHSDRNEVYTAAEEMVEALGSIPFLALHRGLYGNDIPPFDVWVSEQDEQPEEEKSE